MMDLGSWTILIPSNPSCGSHCSTHKWLLVLFEASLTTEQWTLPLTLFESFPIFLPQLGCIMLSQSGSWLFSKFSSNFRHFACSLHVMLMLPFSAWFWFWMRWEFEGQNENQKQFSYSQNHFLGVSQSDFIFRKLFLWMITQKRSLKLNWQPLLYIIFFTQAAHGPYM